MLRVERAGYRTLRYALDVKKIDPASGRVALRLEREPTTREPTTKPTLKPTAMPPPKPTAAPTPSATPSAAPVSTVRPAWCPADEWEPWIHTCRRPSPR